MLDDGSRVGSLVASFTGYRTHPSLLVLLILAAYWAGVVAMLRRASR